MSYKDHGIFWPPFDKISIYDQSKYLDYLPWLFKSLVVDVIVPSINIYSINTERYILHKHKTFMNQKKGYSERQLVKEKLERSTTKQRHYYIIIIIGSMIRQLAPLTNLIQFTRTSNSILFPLCATPMKTACPPLWA